MIHVEVKGVGVDVNLAGETVDILREITGAICGLATSLSSRTGDSITITGSWVMAKLTGGRSYADTNTKEKSRRVTSITHAAKK